MTTFDLEYIEGVLFVRFLANTPDGQRAWREIAEKMSGDAVVWWEHAPAVIKQLRDAGLTVRKAKPVKVSTDEILKKLES